MRFATKQMTIDAVYQDGVLKPVEPLDLDENTRVRVTIELGAETGAGDVLTAVPTWQERWQRVQAIPGLMARLRPEGTGLPARLAGVFSLEWTLFGLAVLVYAITRLWALDQFPIYFFTDEAIHPVLGTELIRNGLRDFEHTFLPTFFNLTMAHFSANFLLVRR